MLAEIQLLRRQVSCRLCYITGRGTSCRDLHAANAALTTALETRRCTRTPWVASTAYSPVRRSVMDRRGLAKPPEKRKVGSSILPLTANLARGMVLCV